MKRRAVLFGLLVLATVRPLTTIAQARRTSQPYRIGSAIDFVSADERSRTIALLREYGWTEGREYVLVESGFPFVREMERAAERIVAAKPDVIVTVNTAYARAVHHRTRSIPIVMWASGYPFEAAQLKCRCRRTTATLGRWKATGPGWQTRMTNVLRESV